MIEIATTIYLFISFCYIFYFSRKEGPSPSLLWVIFQAVIYVGIAKIADLDIAADRMLLFLHWIALPIFILGNCLCNLTHSSRQNKQGEMLFYVRNTSLFWMKCICVITVSFIACIYLYSHAPNVIYVLVKSILSSGQIVSIERLRFAFTQVRGNGYIYQFRVVLLPLINMAFLLSIDKKYQKIAFLLAPFTVYFLLGTGQRGGAVIMFIVFCVNIILFKKYARCTTPKIFYAIVILGAFMFIGLTIANGRAQISGSVIMAIIDRIFYDNQYTAIIGFRFIYEQPVQIGYDWLMRIRDILPWKSGYVPLDFIINDIIYGGMGGTCPPSAVGSIYYNWGSCGTLIFIFFMGYLYRRIALFFMNNRKNIFDLTFYSFYSVSLGSWMAGDILFLFNDGTIAVLLLQLLINSFMKKNIAYNHALSTNHGLTNS